MKCNLSTNIVLNFPYLKIAVDYEDPHFLNQTTPSGKKFHTNNIFLRTQCRLERRKGKMGQSVVAKHR